MLLPHPCWQLADIVVLCAHCLSVRAFDVTAGAQARVRAQLKAYSFDVRAVWLSGDLPLEAPLPWRGLYGACAIQPSACNCNLWPPS